VAAITLKALTGLAKRTPSWRWYLLSHAIISGYTAYRWLSLVSSSCSGALAHYNFWLVIIAVVNAIISIFYYFRVIIAMYFRSADRAEL
jgi:uncharacterized membrane protein